jgi:site-specific DNA-methyltransferase (adenine-specific)
MKSYYDHDGITIYHGDGKSVLDMSPELVICDPPYGMDYQSCWKTEWQRAEKIIGDEAYPMWIFEINPSIAMFACCRWDNLYEIPKPKSFIVWDKCRHGMGDLEHEFGRQWEGIAFYPGPCHKFTTRPIDIIRTPCVPPHALLHPNEKPSQLFSTIILSHSGIIFDPFCGSGSILRCAKDLGRKAIGIEIEERYCEIAAKRLSQEVFIFEPSNPITA